jgi:hypothetical protein
MIAYRYRPYNDYTKDEIKNNYIYLPSYDQLNDKLECFSFIDCYGTRDNWEKFIKNYLIIYCAFRKLACDGIFLEYKDRARPELKIVQDDKLFCYQAAEVNTEEKKSKDYYIWFWSKCYMVKAK